MRRVLVGSGVVLALLAGILVANLLRFPSRQPTAGPVPPMAVDAGAPERLAAALRLRTIAHEDPARLDADEFLALHRHLAESFPVAHRTLRRETVSQLSLLYTWPGRDPALLPLVLLAHMDVVPVEPGTEDAWTQPPFAGRIADGYVWGRGAMDDKIGVLGILEAVEALLADGFAPERTVLLAFGHDEEVGGAQGGAAMARLLQERGVAAECVLDEGLGVTDGAVPWLPGPVALIGIAEKGYLTLELAVPNQGGHSSRPPLETAVGILAAAIARLEQHPMPAAIRGATRQMLEFLGPETSLGPRLALANRWLFGGLVERALAAEPETNALIRTTTAPTMLVGSVMENVLPSRPAAVVNFRLRPGDTTAGVIEHVRETVNDPRVEVRPIGTTRSEPSPEAPVDAPAFAALERTVREIFPRAIVAPALVVGATDGRHYEILTDRVYRFGPYRMQRDDARRAHGTDERLGVTDYLDAIRFYARFIRNLAGS